MKILMLTPYLPFPTKTGGQTRSYNLIKRLSTLGNEITLFSLIKHDSERQYTKELEKYCTEVRIFKRAEKPWTLKNIFRTGFSKYPFLVMRNWAENERETVYEYLNQQNFDIIHAETFYVMPHIPPTDIPVVLVDQTIEYQVYQHFADDFKFLPLKPLLYVDVAKLKFWETKYWKQAKKVVAMSVDDKNIMLSQVADLLVEIVPNGVDVEYFETKKYKRLSDPIILYLGNFTWLQNREAVDVLYKTIWPLIKKEIKNAKLWIIGKSAEDFYANLISEDIRVAEVDDVREAYQSATVLVAPIYSGGGTRLKNFETFASGLPVVTTSIGIGGTEAHDGSEVIIRDDPKEIAKATIELIKNKKLYQKLATNAHKKVAEIYDWDPIAEQLNNIYKEVAGVKA